MVRPSRRAFCKLGPGLHRPLGHGLLVALTRPAFGFLRAPLAATQQAPDARGTIGEAKVVGNESGHALEGPECIVPAMGARPLA